MKTRLAKLTYCLISSTISLLGFSGCAASSKAIKSDATSPKTDEIERPLEEVIVMYGSPTITYQADGRVKDEKGNPIKGVQTKLTEKKSDNE